MTRPMEAAVEAAKLAELKQLITQSRFETLEKLEEAVDAFLWADDEDALEQSSSQDREQRTTNCPGA